MHSATRILARTSPFWLLAVLAPGCGSPGNGQGDDDDDTPVIDAGPVVVDDGGNVVADGGPQQALALQNIDPPHGPYRGGTVVQIRGRNFVEGIKVFIGGRQCEPQDVEILDGRRLRARTPPGDVGPADVIVQTDIESAILPRAFTYDAFYLDPSSGALAGGTLVRMIGKGTSWTPSSTVKFGTRALLNPSFISAGEIQGQAPPAIAAGSVDVTITTGGVADVAEDAFTYYDSSDPIFGGLGGGNLGGSINVSVVDAMTGNVVPGASVFVGNPATTSHRGLTNAMGQIVFSGADIVGRQTVTAAKEKYEAQSFVSFDAKDVTIFLVPLPPPPMPGNLPPGRFAAIIDGAVTFGGPTGVGTTTWDLVPEPRTPTEKKVAQVFTTAPDIFSRNPAPGSGGRVVFQPGANARWWPSRFVARPGALAVVAVAGLEDTVNGQVVFTPFAIGVHRNIVVGPGENKTGVDVLVDLPLDVALQVDLRDPPPLTNLAGPTDLRVDAYLDLGGEGVIIMPGSSVELEVGSHIATIGSQPPILRTLSDSSYVIVASCDTSAGPPESVRILKGITDLTRPIVVEGWHGIPRAIDPVDGGTASGPQLRWRPDGGDAIGTFNFMTLETFDSPSTPLWRIVTRGDVFQGDMPDLRALEATLPEVPPPPADLFWVVYSITVPGITFDQFTYNNLNQRYWSAHAVNYFVVKVP